MSPTGRGTAWVAGEFDRRADTYDDSAMHRWQAEIAARLLQPRPGQRLLDIATGTGLAARACAALTGSPGDITGIDISLRMLQTAAGRSTSSYLQADAARLPFRPAVFDAVLCVAAIPYLPDLTLAVTEWTRVAHPTAALVATTPAADGITALRLIRHAAAHHGLDLLDPHAGLGTPDHITRRMTSLGLTIESIAAHAYPEQLPDDPRAAFDHTLDYGFAEPLRTAPDDERARIYDTYATAYETEKNAGTATQTVLFTTARFPAPPPADTATRSTTPPDRWSRARSPG